MSNSSPTKLRNWEQWFEKTAMNGMVPPQAVDVERSLLGAMMIDRTAVHKVIEVLGAVKDVHDSPFYREQHGYIYQAIVAVDREGVNPDLLSVSNELREMGKFDQCGGLPYIIQLTGEVVTTANVEAHAKILVEKRVLRSTIRTAEELKYRAFIGEDNPYDLLVEADRQFSHIGDIGRRTDGVRQIGELSKPSLERLDRIATNGGGLTGLTTGLRELDSLTNGWQKQTVVVVAARPGMGKTALTLNFAQSATMSNDGEIGWVLYISLEMSATQLWLRLVVAMAQVDMGKVDRATLTDDEMRRIMRAVEKLRSIPFYVDDTPRMTFEEIRAKTRKVQQMVDPNRELHGLLIIDYLGLMALPKGTPRHEAVGDNSGALLALAKECDITVMPCVQLNREVEKRKDCRPMLSDLRDSGSIEQDAHIVLFVYRPEYYDIAVDKDGNSTEGLAILDVAKHRNGRQDEVMTTFIGSEQRFTDRETIHVPAGAASFGAPAWE